MKQSSRKFLFLLAAAILVCSLAIGAQAQETPQLTPVETKNEFGSVTYPTLSGYPGVQDAINQAIYDKAQIAVRLETLQGLKADGWGLQVDYRSTLQNDVLSVLVSALGEMENGRMGQVYTSVNFDLLTGKSIAPEDLFTDVEGAFSYMEGKLDEEVAPSLSGYTENDQLTPIPRDNFFLTSQGVTFFYPQDQFSMLSGYSGGCSFFWYELKDYLNLSEGSPLNKLGAGDYLALSPDSAGPIGEAVKAGQLPGIDARIGENLTDVFDQYRLLVEPDYYPGGRFFELEAPEFRGVWLLSDALTESYDASQMQGIRADRVNLYGLQPGVTTREEWQAVLGQPESTTELDEYTAEDYRLPAGTSDYYRFGDNQLLLHADETGTLVSVQLVK
jgi:hypothetical protein